MSDEVPALPEDLVVYLYGPFRATGPDGADVTPVSLKSQGLIALLATAPDLRRTRSWIADKLWSDRDPEHAAGSLRQALAEIRRAFGAAVGALGSDRNHVWLVRDRTRIDRSARGEFLEGMDIRDVEWNDWLREQRTLGQPDRQPVKGAAGDPGAPPREPEVPCDNPLVLGLLIDRNVSDESRFLGGVVAEVLARNLTEASDCEIILGSDATSGLHLSVAPHRGDAGTGITVSLRKGGTGGYIWSGSRKIGSRLFPNHDDIDFHALLFEALDATLSGQLAMLPRIQAAPPPAIMTQIAARKIMTFETLQLREAEAILEEICACEPTVVSMAWLLFLNRIAIIERTTRLTPERKEHLTALCARVLELGRNNAFALAAVSGLYLRMLGRPAEATELARRAVRINPASPFAVDALASAMYLQGRAEEGYRLSRIARTLTANTKVAHFFEMSLCLAAIMTGRVDHATQLANSAVALAPNFRAAWRYRIALSAHAGVFEDVAFSGSRLQEIEADFSIDRLLEDPDYPATVIRTSELCVSALRALT